MFKNNLIKKIANFLNLKELGKRALTVIILTMTAIITVWVYAAFTEPLAGPNDSDQDFLQNILGANNADNDFDSSAVVANTDGSIIERMENIENLIKQFRSCVYSDAVGTFCGGGVKYAEGYIAMPSGCSGATNNPSCSGTDTYTRSWSASTGTDEPADSTTDGLTNTKNLLNNPTDNGSATDTLAPVNDAALYCFNLILNGKTDWYLPAKDQLNTLYGQKATVGGFIAGGYWSSTENGTTYGWAQNFTNGAQYYDTKTNADYVRCVRSY